MRAFRRQGSFPTFSRLDPVGHIALFGAIVVAEERLSAVLSEFARTLVTDFPIQGILDHLVQRIVDVLPVGAAGVALISPTTHPRFVAGSDSSAVRYEQLQTDLNEGPCLAAFETDGPITIPNLAEDVRFPRFARSALAQGLVAVFTFPLRNGDRCLGALDLYRETPGPLSKREMAIAQTLADVATAYLLNAQARAAKTEFVATVSHELRTPMTSIRGFIELLEDDQPGTLTGEQLGFIDAIRRNCDRLTSLADDLLTLSSLDTGTFGHEQTEVDLVHAVSAAQATLEPAIALRRLETIFEIPVGPVMVRGDLHDLECLVTNLMSNALKFTLDGGWVRCTLQSLDGMACLAVSDNGIGIPEEEQANLFARFFRSSTAQQHAIPGSGLGLTIVDSIVQRHGGDISVDSKHMAGSTFTVNLPLISL
jgi:signal transduction histidine kinase